MIHSGNECCRSSGDSDATSTSAVETTLERLRGTRGALEELWSDRERRLELTLRLRHFERDALEVSILHCRYLSLTILIARLKWPHRRVDTHQVVYNISKRWCLSKGTCHS